MTDPKPMIFVCDKHGYIVELIEYLVRSNKKSYIEQYVLQFNTNAAPKVLGTLMDLEEDDK